MTRWWFVRQGLSVLVLPVTVAVVIPVWIARSAGSDLGVPTSPLGWTASALGLVALVAGAALFVACLFLINAVYIPLLEEPRLRARFGEDYEAYAGAVPRLIPRLRPWQRADERGRRAP